jgi:hypothetical protein
MANKYRFLFTLVVVVSLLFSVVNVFAGPYSGTDLNTRPTQAPHGNGNGGGQNLGGGQPEKTPGAEATEKAVERATEGKGNPNGADKQNNPQGGKRVTYKGTIAAADAASLTLTLADGRSLTFVISTTTQIKIPTRPQSGYPGPGSGLNIGANALVQAQTQADESLLALRIHIVPGQPEKIHRVGIVIEYTPGESITIVAKGNEYTFALTASTKILPDQRADQLDMGALVTIISRRDPAGGPLTAQGIVVHPAAASGGTPGTPTPTATATATPTPTATVTAPYP